LQDWTSFAFGIGLIMKHCKKCDTTKPKTEFGKDKGKKDGLSTVCLQCRRKYDLIRMKSDKRITLRKSKKMKDWYSNYNKQPHRRAKARDHQNNVTMLNPQNRIAANTRNLIRLCIRRSSNTESFNKYVGCSLWLFRKHIEKQFTDGMNWENYAQIWEFDHIKPLSTFDLTNESELLKASNYKNVQPLFCNHNKEKSNKLLIDKNNQLQLMLC
jgi:hypothetical protein